MTEPNQYIRFLVRLLIWVIIGIIVSNVATLVLAIAVGLPLDSLTDGSWLNTAEFNTDHMRLVLLLNHLFMFVAAGMVAFRMHYGRDWAQKADLTTGPPVHMWIPGIAALLLSFPAIQWLYQMNQKLPLPGYLFDKSDMLNALIEQMLKVNAFGSLLLNILVIAVVPAIGEELIFRAGLQKHLLKWIKLPHTAIWLSACLFSVLHMQFDGLLPRIALGALLGYLYYYSGSLWLPIVAHFVNNGAQVVLAYVRPDLIDDIDHMHTEVPWYYGVVSLVSVVFLLHRLQTMRPWQRHV